MYDEVKYPFAKEFRNAHLSKIEQPDDVIEKLKNWTTNPKNLLYFAGSVGCGKTYFSAAFYNYLKEKHEELSKKAWEERKDGTINPPRWDYRYFTEYGLFSNLRGHINQGHDWEACLERICENTFLILDDMGASRLSEWQIDVLHTLIDLRVSNLQPTLITSNIFTKDLNNHFHPRVKSRICAARNLVIELDGEDKRQHVENKL